LNHLKKADSESFPKNVLGFHKQTKLFAFFEHRVVNKIVLTSLAERGGISNDKDAENFLFRGFLPTAIGVERGAI